MYVGYMLKDQTEQAIRSFPVKIIFFILSFKSFSHLCVGFNAGKAEISFDPFFKCRSCGRPTATSNAANSTSTATDFG
jgi:hypothetical protein